MNNLVLDLDERRETVKKNNKSAKKFLFIFAAMILLIAGFVVYDRIRTNNIKQQVLAEYKAEKFEELNAAMVKEIISPASELTTLKCYYTSVDTYEDYRKLFGKKVPFTTDEILYSFDGIVSAGVDLSEVDCEVDNENKTINIALPEPTIFSHEINTESFKTWDVKDSIFTEKDLDDFTEQLSDLKSLKEEELAEDDEFYQSVTENAQDILANLFTMSESTKDYQVIFSDQSGQKEINNVNFENSNAE